MALTEILQNDSTAAVRTKVNAAIDALNALAGEPNRAVTTEAGLGTAIAREASRAEAAELSLSAVLGTKAGGSDLSAEMTRAEQVEAGLASGAAQEVLARQAAVTGLQAAFQTYRSAFFLPPDRPGDGSAFFGMATNPLVISITPSNSLGASYFLTAANGALANAVSQFYAAMVGESADVGLPASLAYRSETVPAGGPLETLFIQWLKLPTTASNPGPGLGYTDAQVASTLAAIRSQALATQAGTTGLPADPSQFPALSSASIVVGGEGAVCRLFGGGYVAASTFFAIEPDRIYDARLAFSRSQDPADPSGDDVRFGAFLYDAGKTLLGSVTLADFPLALVASGRQRSNALLSRLAAPPAGVTTLQGAARYARPFVETFGGAQQTDIEVIGWRDVTEMARLAAASGAALGSVFA